jgi:Zn ribbon nucleic-acid-binding protein
MALLLVLRGVDMGGAKAVWMEEQERGWTSFRGKYVCANCFDDDAIKALIHDNVESEECTYCGRSSKSGPIAADMNCVMEDIYFGICQEWRNPNSEGVPWESAEGGWQGEVIDSWDLLHDYLRLGIGNDALLHDLCKSIEGSQWCQRNFWGFLPQKEMAVDWQRFSNIIKYETRFLFLKQTAEPESNERPSHEILDLLGHYFKDFKMTRSLPTGTALFRARRHGKGPEPRTIEELGPPPKDKARSSNRMSPAGIPMFYGAFDEKTAIAEVCSDPSDLCPLVTVGRFVVTNPMRVIDMSAIPDVPSQFDRKRARQRAASIFLQGFLKDFIEPVVKDGREHIDYVPTQVVTEYIRRVFRENDAEVHGVIYPSAVSTGKSCVLFLEAAAKGEWAHVDLRSVEKWLKLDISGIKTTPAAHA